ncbi:uncharacterized protein V6R79_019680 [Siganus canaliculatus]
MELQLPDPGPYPDQNQDGLLKSCERLIRCEAEAAVAESLQDGAPPAGGGRSQVEHLLHRVMDGRAMKRSDEESERSVLVIKAGLFCSLREENGPISSSLWRRAEDVCAEVEPSAEKQQELSKRSC